MKVKLLFIILLLACSASQSEAQIGKGTLGKILNKSKKKAERKVEKRVENKIDETIDETLEDVMTPKKEEETTTKEAEAASIAAIKKAKDSLEDQAKRLQLMLKEGGIDSPYLEGDLKRFRQNLDDYIKTYPTADFVREENFYEDFSKKYKGLLAAEEKK